MENIKQICDEILEEIKKNNVETKRELNQIKLRILNRRKPNGKIKHIPKNADIYFAASEDERKDQHPRYRQKNGNQNLPVY